jgi:hypothetical protein
MIGDEELASPVLTRPLIWPGSDSAARSLTSSGAVESPSPSSLSAAVEGEDVAAVLCRRACRSCDGGWVVVLVGQRRHRDEVQVAHGPPVASCRSVAGGRAGRTEARSEPPHARPAWEHHGNSRRGTARDEGEPSGTYAGRLTCEDRTSRESAGSERNEAGRG